MAESEVKCAACGEPTPIRDALEAVPTDSEGRTPTVTLCGSCFLERRAPSDDRSINSDTGHIPHRAPARTNDDSDDDHDDEDYRRRMRKSPRR
jgi:hypothetical protein